GPARRLEEALPASWRSRPREARAGRTGCRRGRRGLMAPKVERMKPRVALAKRPLARREDALFARVLEIVQAARGHAARSVNSAMVRAYWMIGREIVEVEQAGESRAGYGEEVINRLAERLTSQVGPGFGARTLRRLRLFYLTYPGGSSIAD